MYQKNLRRGRRKEFSRSDDATTFDELEEKGTDVNEKRAHDTIALLEEPQIPNKHSVIVIISKCHRGAPTKVFGIEGSGAGHAKTASTSFG